MGCFLFKQKTGYELRISDWSSDVCSSDLINVALGEKIRLLKGVGPIIVLFMMVTGVLFVGIATPVAAASLGAFGAMMFVRSEERRVGPECVCTCRSRWSTSHYKKTNNRTLYTMTFYSRQSQLGRAY